MIRHEQKHDLVELGAISRKTKGGTRGYVDAERTLQPIYGLSAD